MMRKSPLLDRLRQKKKERKGIVTGVCWYTESQWARLKETAADPKRFESTFADWTAMAEEQLLALKKVGIFPVKVLIDPDDFSAWCKERSQRNDASARAEYVSTRVRLAHKGNA
jgi:hypothetical protein